MVILLKQHAPQAEQERLLAWLRELGAEVRVTGTPERPFFCLTGDISRIDPSLAARFPAVEDVLRLTEPYPLCSRRLHPEPTVVSVGGARFGGGNFGLIAGPCAVESEEQIFTAARQAKAAGVCLLRGGAFKPRTSPYDFSGLGAEGLRLLIAAGHETGLPVVSELMSAAQTRSPMWTSSRSARAICRTMTCCGRSAAAKSRCCSSAASAQRCRSFC